MNETRNPLLSLDYGTPYNTFPFHRITNEDIEEAINEGMCLENEEIRAIADNPEQPTFENTIVALTRTGAILERATTVMYNLLSAHRNDGLEELANRMAPVLSEHSGNIMLNTRLFKRVKAVYEQARLLSHLNDEDHMLLERTYEGFENSGATLPEEKKERYREIKKELSQLTVQFEQNKIKDLNAFQLHLTDETDLDGIPESRRQEAAAAAHEKGLEGWMFTLHAPSLSPFLTYSNRDDLRKKMYVAYNTLCTHDNEHNNFEVCRRIVNLRLELAQLFGYKTFADYVLKRRMAQDYQHVSDLYSNLVDKYLPVAKADVKAIEDFAEKPLSPWDFAHYSYLLKKRDYNVDAEMLRPYFPLDNVIKGVFGLATTLYGITFRENCHIPVYHPDVKVYEVIDHDGSFLAVLYADFFARESKQSGAWMTGYREQSFDGVKGMPQFCDHRPHVSVTMNFQKPIPASTTTEAKPSLLTLGEVSTFLHEFGHALHGIFARTRYASLSGTNVYWDFVELPSQFMENYAMEPDFLRTFARHYLTGEPLPDDLIARVRRAQNFNAAYACIRQVSLGVLDMSYYTRTEPLTDNIREYEHAAWKHLQLLPAYANACMSVQFGHIMSGGYAAGYYSYKWAEVLDADAFEAFRERGMFSREVAQDFRDKILSKGGTIHPASLYRDFRGHDATIDALLRRDGIK